MKRFLILLLILLAVPTAVYGGVDSDEYARQLSGFDLSAFDEKLDKDTKNMLGELGLDGFDFESLSGLSINDISKIAVSVIKGKIDSPLKAGVSVLVFVLLSAFFQGMKFDSGEMSKVFSISSALVIAILLVVKIGTAMSLGAATMKIAADFIYAFIPTFCSIIAVSGGITTSFSTNTTLLLLSQGLSFISSNVFMPLTNIFLAVGICSALNTEINLGKFISVAKGLITRAISIIAGLFVSVLSIKTSVAARSDILGIRSVRFVINSVVPVIGATISEGLLSIQSYSSLIKSSVGIVGIIAVALVFLPSIIEVFVWRMVLSICILAGDMFGENSLSAMLKVFSDAMLIMNVILILSMVTTIISFGILIAAKTG